MIDASTHTRKIWRSHFDGADSTYNSNQSQKVVISAESSIALIRTIHLGNDV
jgi:hypothetical protein